MKVLIETIPHEEQRYPTPGDWQFVNGVLKIRVSQLSDSRYETLMATHEFVEAMLCLNDNITGDQVDVFDKQFEFYRQPGDVSEPGDDPNAVYHKQHFIATNIERQMAQHMLVDWRKYEAEVNSLA